MQNHNLKKKSFFLLKIFGAANYAHPIIDNKFTPPRGGDKRLYPSSQIGEPLIMSALFGCKDTKYISKTRIVAPMLHQKERRLLYLFDNQQSPKVLK